MKNLRQPFLVFGLVFCFLLVGSIFASQSAAHSLGHAHHHDATTHATLLCSWVCAAGEVLEVGNVIFDTSYRLISKVEPFSIILVRTASEFFTFQRGPPLSSF